MLIYKFVKKVSLFFFYVVISIYFFFLLDDGRADAAYQKFTTPKVGSMILGNSKAGQNLVPSVFNEELKGIYEEPIYNYSFSLYASPFGSVYTKAIKRKLKSNAGKSLFIVTVDPWSISGPIRTPNDQSTFEENKLYLNDLLIVDINPNPFYLFRHYEKSFYEILIQRIKPGYTKIHKDGWWETEDYINKEVVASRTAQIIKSYTEYAKKHEFSELRLKYLTDLLIFLKSKGDVFIIRLPLHPSILEIENKAILNFESIITKISENAGVQYYDMNFLSSKLHFEDGLHLDTESSMVLSNYIAEFVKQNRMSSDEN